MIRMETEKGIFRSSSQNTGKIVSGLLASGMENIGGTS